MNPEELLIHADFIHDLALSLVRDEHRAVDISQSTWLAMLENPPKRDRPVRSWLARVVRNFTVSSYRRETRRVRREKAVAASESLPSAQAMVEKMEIRRILIEAVLGLDEPYRSTVILRFYEGLSSRDIGERLGISVETVRTRVKRGIGRLKRELDVLHDGDRRGWCLALAPLAGVSLTTVATKAGATALLSLPGVIAMTTKAKMLLILCAVLLLSGSAYFIMNILPDEEAPEDVSIVQLDEEIKDVADQGIVEPPSAEIVRETLVPELENDALPASWLAAQGGFSGRVVLEDGTPVPNQKVEIVGLQSMDLFNTLTAFGKGYSDDLTTTTATTRTFEDGSFLLSGVFGHSYFVLRIDASKHPSLTRLIDKQPGPGQTADLGDIALESGAVIVGKVVDAHGNPVEGVTVRAMQMSPFLLREGVQNLCEGGSLMYEFGIFGTRWYVVDLPPVVKTLERLLDSESTKTREDGTFQLNRVSKEQTMVLFDRDGYCPFWDGPVSISNESMHDMGTLTLIETTKSVGRVVDANHDPVPGVEVRVGARNWKSNLSILRPPVITGDDGSFPLEGVINTTTYCVLRRHVGEGWVVTGPFRSDDDDVTVTLPTGYDLQVKVFEKANVPAEQAELRIRCTHDFDFLSPRKIQRLAERVEQTSPGVFEIKDLAPGEYEVGAKASGFGIAVTKIEIDGSDHVENMTLNPAHPLTVTVYDQAGVVALRDVEVFVEGRSVDWFEDALECQRDRTDENGRVAFTELPPGECSVCVYHPAHGSGSRNVEIPKDNRIDIRLDSTGRLEGRVLHSQGFAKPPFTVFLQWDGHDRFSVSSFPHCGTTDSDGVFTFDHLQPGKYDLRVVERLFNKNLSSLFQVAMTEPLAEGNIEIYADRKTTVEVLIDSAFRQPLSRVSGTVLLNGEVPEGAWIRLQTNESQMTATLDSKGCYSLEKVHPGDCVFQVQFPADNDGAQDMVISREVRIAPGEDRVEDFFANTGSVYGHVEVRLEDHGLPTLRIILSSDFSVEENHSALTTASKSQIALKAWSDSVACRKPIKIEQLLDENGAFFFPRVPDGFYQITATYDLDSTKMSFADFFKTQARHLPQSTAVEVTAGLSTGPVVLKIDSP